jgi:hypothetical protein
MFKLNLWLHVALLLVAGALLMFLGTPYLYDSLIPPLERSARQMERAISGELIHEAEESVSVAAALASNPEVRAAFTPAPAEGAALAETVVTAAQAALLKPEHSKLGRVAIGALIKPDGTVVVKGGPAEMPPNLSGEPVVKDGLSGRTLDGLLTLGNLHRVAVHPIFENQKVIGLALIGWPIDQKYVARVAEFSGLPVAGVLGDQVVGNIDGLETSAIKEVRGPGSVGTLDLAVPDPMPLFVTDRTRFLVGKVALAPGVNDARIVYAIDRNPALNTLAQGQAAVGGVTVVLALLMMFSLWAALRSIYKPLDMILEHLSKFKQGQATGVLPVAALKGPFLRLGKQINMILESPGLTGGPRPGTPPLAPPGSVPQTPSEGVEAPPAGMFTPDEASGGATPPGPPPADDPNLQPVSEALVSDEFKQSAISSLFDEASSDPLQAFRVPPGGNGAAGPPTPPPTSDDPLGLMGGAAPPVESAPPVAPPPAATAPPSAEPGFNRDSTVMVPIPEALLEKSAAVPSSPGAPPVSMDEPPSDSTVVAQIPSELLDAAVPQRDQGNEDETHFREVFQEFLKVREQCGEDVSQLTYERFVAKLMKNRQAIIEKYHSKSVRFQVYVKQGKAALRAVPVKA